MRLQGDDDSLWSAGEIRHVGAEIFAPDPARPAAVDIVGDHHIADAFYLPVTDGFGISVCDFDANGCPGVAPQAPNVELVSEARDIERRTIPEKPARHQTREPAAVDECQHRRCAARQQFIALLYFELPQLVSSYLTHESARDHDPAVAPDTFEFAPVETRHR